jgi:hypothetical protein
MKMKNKKEIFDIILDIAIILGMVLVTFKLFGLL